MKKTACEKLLPVLQFPIVFWIMYDKRYTYLRGTWVTIKNNIARPTREREIIDGMVVGDPINVR